MNGNPKITFGIAPHIVRPPRQKHKDLMCTFFLSLQPVSPQPESKPKWGAEKSHSTAISEQTEQMNDQTTVTQRFKRVGCPAMRKVQSETEEPQILHEHSSLLCCWIILDESPCCLSFQNGKEKLPAIIFPKLLLT
jgi:hypothetical protein